MSATGRNVPGHERDPRDFYETPRWAVEAALDWLSPWTPTLDPCAGHGALLVRGGRGIEIDPFILRGPLISTGDGLALLWRGERVFMNPPFGDAQRWIIKAVDEADSACVLMRLGYLAGQKRREWWIAHPPDGILVLSRRPSFAHGKTDNADYCWVAWGVSVPVRHSRCTSVGWAA